jgi:hypothetical protein
MLSRCSWDQVIAHCFPTIRFPSGDNDKNLPISLSAKPMLRLDIHAAAFGCGWGGQ